MKRKIQRGKAAQKNNCESILQDNQVLPVSQEEIQHWGRKGPAETSIMVT